MKIVFLGFYYFAECEFPTKNLKLCGIFKFSSFNSTFSNFKLFILNQYFLIIYIYNIILSFLINYLLTNIENSYKITI
jgi:hypothetical protein